jgi:flavin reductase (DIM6/NTAB) family NADH-FMN oxidoreductase RutF
MMSVDHNDEQLRRAMRRFASGVTIVTLFDGERDAGLTVSSFTSISLEPPIIMIALNAGGSGAEALGGVTSFAVHILGFEHEDLSIRFAESVPWIQKVAGLLVSRGSSGVSILDPIPTVIEAKVRSQVIVGTHHVIFGNVVGIRLEDPAPERPLLYYDRDYGTVERPVGGTGENNSF